MATTWLTHTQPATMAAVAEDEGRMALTARSHRANSFGPLPSTAASKSRTKAKVIRQQGSARWAPSQPRLPSSISIACRARHGHCRTDHWSTLLEHTTGAHYWSTAQEHTGAHGSTAREHTGSHHRRTQEHTGAHWITLDHITGAHRSTLDHT
eukprot:3658741-Pyramimonas_sp.AAC.1